MAGKSAAANRKYGKGNDRTYLFPRHPNEIDRLDVQHYALREKLGANYLAPVDRPARILDVGSGTGQWSYELADEFPDALVVGFDLVPSKPDAPPNYRFVRGNLLQGLPFSDECFDFVHQRLMVSSAIPLKFWASVMKELVRVLRPGGWIELVETTPEVEPAGPATRRVVELLQRLGRSLGLDTTGIVTRSLDQHLRRGGIVDVEKRAFELPIGEWGGPVGSLIATDVRAASMRLCDTFVTKFGLSAEECRELVRTMQQEWEQHRSTGPVAVAFGRKPEP